MTRPDGVIGFVAEPEPIVAFCHDAPGSGPTMRHPSRVRRTPCPTVDCGVQPVARRGSILSVPAFAFPMKPHSARFGWKADISSGALQGGR